MTYNMLELGPVVSESDIITPVLGYDELFWGSRTSEEAEAYCEEQRKAMEEDRKENNYFLANLKTAKENGLEHEFLDGFFDYLRSGDTITQATWSAMYDWDM